ncbi:30S ribosomal protein S6 [Candidatus Berkelbacteria bacterium]|nr:30S ribosomal protein S6 [Candidatus Berkelbacteria bacterium]
MSEETATTKLYLLSALVKTEADFAELEKFIKEFEVTVKKSENLGERKLAFQIKKESTLLLTSIFFETDTQTAKKIDKEIKTEEHVCRYLLTDWKGDIDTPKRNYRNSRPHTEKEVKEEVNV